MKKRILALILTLALALTLFPLTVYAEDGGDPVSFAFERGYEEDRYYDGDTVYLPLNGQLYLGFDIDPYNGLAPGWRNDLLEAQGFAIDADPTFFEGDNFAYAHIKAGTKKIGDVGTLEYDWYNWAEVEQYGFIDAPKYYHSTVKIEVIDPLNFQGDADGDGELSIFDATAIQRTLAGLSTESFSMLTADTDRDGEVTILDATIIQRHLANIPSPGHEGVGEEISYGTYYAGWNIEQDLLPEGVVLGGDNLQLMQARVRTALSLLVDRGRILSDALPVERQAANSFVPKWITDADGSEFHANSGEGGGYFDAADHDANVEKAIQLLKGTNIYTFDEETGKFTDFPELHYIHNVGEVHAAIANVIKEDFAAVGITLIVEARDWGSYLDDLAAKNYSLARNGWVEDRDDPMLFLSMWTTDSEENSFGLGQGAHANVKIFSVDLTPYGGGKIENGTWAETYDVLIDMIGKCENRADAYAMMHLAEDLLMSTGCIMPLYYY